MLNFFLRQMVGKKYHDINVKNPGRFKFEPRFEMSFICLFCLKTYFPAKIAEMLCWASSESCSRSQSATNSSKAAQK
jgi:hypothetical protein